MELFMEERKDYAKKVAYFLGEELNQMTESRPYGRLFSFCRINVVYKLISSNHGNNYNK